MLADFVQKLSDLAVQAAQPRLVDYGDPRIKLLIDGSGCQSLVVPPHIRDHSIADLNSLVTAVTDFGAESTVFHDHNYIVALLDGDDRRDAVRMPLLKSQLFGTVNALTGKVFDQRQFVEFLRHDFYDVLGASLLPQVRKIEVATSSRKDREINPGRERGTQEFAAELADADKLPEVVTVPMPVYVAKPLLTTYPIRLSLNFNVSTLTFVLKPLPDELVRMIDAAQQDIHEFLCNELPDATVLYGSP